MEKRTQESAPGSEIMGRLDGDTQGYLIHEVMNGSVSPDAVRFDGETFAVVFRGEIHETKAQGLVAAGMNMSSSRLELDHEHMEAVNAWMNEGGVRHFGLHWVDVESVMAGMEAIVVSVDQERLFIIP